VIAAPSYGDPESEDTMNRIQPSKAGIAAAITLGALHALWAVLVALNGAQPVTDFLYRLHFIEPSYTVQPFRIVTAISLVLFTAAVGYAAGVTFGLVWNRLQAKESKAWQGEPARAAGRSA
jgi:hypothetical protein